MKIIDITGPIYEGMWEFGFPHGHFKLLQLDYEYLGHRYTHEGFEGLVGTAGTFIQTGATYHGYKKFDSTYKIPLKRLVNVDAYILQIPLKELQERDGRKSIQLKDIKSAEKEEIPEDAAIIVSTGYSKNWERNDFVDMSPFFKRDALYYLLDKSPNIIASDFPTWENKLNPENSLERLFSSGAIVMPNCINLEKIKKYKVKLIVLPVKILDVCACPVRAIVIEE